MDWPLRPRARTLSEPGAFLQLLLPEPRAAAPREGSLRAPHVQTQREHRAAVCASAEGPWDTRGALLTSPVPTRPSGAHHVRQARRCWPGLPGADGGHRARPLGLSCSARTDSERPSGGRAKHGGARPAICVSQAFTWLGPYEMLPLAVLALGFPPPRAAVLSSSGGGPSSRQPPAPPGHSSTSAPCSEQGPRCVGALR